MNNYDIHLDLNMVEGFCSLTVEDGGYSIFHMCGDFDFMLGFLKGFDFYDDFLKYCKNCFKDYISSRSDDCEV